MFAILVSYARKILAPTVVQVREGIELAGTKRPVGRYIRTNGNVTSSIVVKAIVVSTT